jgi:hypothetical protein
MASLWKLTLCLGLTWCICGCAYDRSSFEYSSASPMPWFNLSLQPQKANTTKYQRPISRSLTGQQHSVPLTYAVEPSRQRNTIKPHWPEGLLPRGRRQSVATDWARQVDETGMSSAMTAASLRRHGRVPSAQDHTPSFNPVGSSLSVAMPATKTASASASGVNGTNDRPSAVTVPDAQRHTAADSVLDAPVLPLPVTVDESEESLNNSRHGFEF